jgi:predicted RNA binding protein YcfA (HicA-like mRNA interferase family)
MTRLLERLGFVAVRQRGSHLRLIHPDGRRTTVAIHARDLPTGTIRAILQDVGITVEEYEALRRG